MIIVSDLPRNFEVFIPTIFLFFLLKFGFYLQRAESQRVTMETGTEVTDLG